MSHEENRMGFVRSKLPWIAGAAALLVFLLTLNHWVNLRSLPVVAKVTGWELGLPVQSPLFQLVTFPIRFFPESIQPFLLNLFSALCGALTIALLARSVALLPHDRTHEQRLRERSDYSLLSINLAWVPVVLAVCACALQLTFWEHATAATGQMLDLLVFAYVVRCLLEYRISMDEGWLSKMALLYGLGITNNFALIAFFPLFLGALIWIRGVQFFDPGFLVRMVVLGLAGLTLYLLLPMVWMIKGEKDYTFFQVLRTNWAGQKMLLVDTPPLRNRVLLLSLTSILPVFLMGIRWRSSSGETSAAGATLTNVAFRSIHLFILAACLFVTFDPRFSPRELGFGVPFLTFYYLGAVAIGYYSGYALLVFSNPSRKSWRPENPAGKIFNPIIRAVVLITMVAVPAGLVWKNLPRVRAADGTVLKEFVAQSVKALPKAPAYLLSEDAFQLTLLQANLSGQGRKNDYVLVNTRSLEAPEYHEQLHKQYGDRWPMIASREELGSRIMQLDIQEMIRRLASSNSVTYLHPSFGYFFEAVYARPDGASYTLVPFAKDQVLPPRLTAEQLSANQAFWNANSADHQKIQDLKKLNSQDAQYVAQFYSRGLNSWGVQLQQAGRVTEAAKEFALAYNLNTNNIPAKLNAEFNKAFQAGNTSSFDPSTTLEQKFGTYRTWDAMLQENGPFDHPDFCAMLGDGFISQNQYRQAAFEYSRTIFFQPTNFPARLMLAKAYIYGNWTDLGITELDKIERDFNPPTPAQKANIVAARSAAFYGKNDFSGAEELLKNARASMPEDDSLTQALFELYRVSGKYSNALAIVDQQLQISPTNTPALLQKAELQLNSDDLPGAHATVKEVLNIAPRSASALLVQAFVYIRQSDYAQAQASIDKILQQDPENSQAILYKGIVMMEQKQTDKAREAFDKLLEKQPDNIAALRNRAILSLRAQRWNDAKEDYTKLRKITPRSHAVMYGLGEIAYAQKNFIDATGFYEAYLRYAPANASGELLEEKKKVEDRLKELKSVTK